MMSRSNTKDDLDIDDHAGDVKINMVIHN